MAATKTFLILAFALGLVSAVPASPADINPRQNGCPDGYYPRVDCEGRDKCQVVVPGCPEGYYVDPADNSKCIVLPC